MISNSLGTYVIEPGQTITFDGRASYDLDGGGIAAYHWFENGSSSHSSASPTFVKTYYSYGNFTLKLRVTDHPPAGHNPSTDEKTVTIQVRPSVAGTKYYITDHLGSVRSTVNHLGQVVGQEDFWSYGLTMPGRSWNNGNAYDRYKFTGHERDSEGGLDWEYMIARNYDPEIGRFMGVDPHFMNYANLNPFHYVMGNPIKYLDPTGKDTLIFIDLAKNPNNRGQYTADVLHIKNGEIVGFYVDGGSTYPNYPDTQAGDQNTLDEGEYDYSNEYGHKGDTELGINIIDKTAEDKADERRAPGRKPGGSPVTMTNVNVHSGQTETTNRGSAGCPTLTPSVAGKILPKLVGTTGKVVIRRDKRMIGTFNTTSNDKTKVNK